MAGACSGALNYCSTRVCMGRSACSKWRDNFWLITRQRVTLNVTDAMLRNEDILLQSSLYDHAEVNVANLITQKHTLIFSALFHEKDQLNM